jgi:hypothetical protein
MNLASLGPSLREIAEKVDRQPDDLTEQMLAAYVDSCYDNASIIETQYKLLQVAYCLIPVGFAELAVGLVA